MQRGWTLEFTRSRDWLDSERALRQTNDMATPAIIRDPEIMSGQPVFAGTRVLFQTLLDYIEGGETLDEFLDDFPTVTREMAITALENAKETLLASIG